MKTGLIVKCIQHLKMTNVNSSTLIACSHDTNVDNLLPLENIFVENSICTLRFVSNILFEDPAGVVPYG